MPVGASNVAPARALAGGEVDVMEMMSQEQLADLEDGAVATARDTAAKKREREALAAEEQQVRLKKARMMQQQRNEVRAAAQREAARAEVIRKIAVQLEASDVSSAAAIVSATMIVPRQLRTGVIPAVMRVPAEFAELYAAQETEWDRLTDEVIRLTGTAAGSEVAPLAEEARAAKAVLQRLTDTAVREFAARDWFAILSRDTGTVVA
jgi:tryptophan 2,3-dioxygenase